MSEQGVEKTLDLDDELVPVWSAYINGRNLPQVLP